MIAKLEKPERAKALFGDWQESLIWSCLENVMGSIYADNDKNPESAMAILGDFCYFAGKPDKELALYKPEWCKKDFIIMVPQDDKWGDLIEESYGSKATKVTRYAIKKEGDIFDRKKLQEAVDSLSPEYEMKMMDEESFERCMSNDWSRDFCAQFEDYEMYDRLGIGVVILKDGEIAAGVSSYTSYREGIEIEIGTKEAHRRKGLAYACAAKIILECLKRGLYPNWDAQNRQSASLAEKLGYHFDREYHAYEIRGYSS